MRQKKTWSSNDSYDAFLPISSKDGYACANISITKGFTSAPMTIQECFERFPDISQMADALGIRLEKTVGNDEIYNFWTGPGTGPIFDQINNPLTPGDLNLRETSKECNLVDAVLGSDWLGCLWGSPEASFSCTCPYIGNKFEAYLKHRLTVATFWNTPKYVPVQRREFADEFEYGNRIEIVVDGDHTLHPGLVVEIDVTAASGYPYYFAAVDSTLNGKYWIIEVKQVFSSGGTHETRLTLAKMAVTTPV